MVELSVHKVPTSLELTSETVMVESDVKNKIKKHYEIAGYEENRTNFHPLSREG